ncbi:DUF1574 family protein [Pontibacter lucknowensis]|uniref:SGNH/GDSL hydrolase family protein n=1 Tax=Pontibacter lucknowensis TaxID=1077936 RepID=A0A1N6Y6N0_9BACT|nr:DUF1574 family protein [Pontibacter lucknowensis]SIR10282.1 Protein of unknown function [Pontibacter lucknowensis]
MKKLFIRILLVFSAFVIIYLGALTLLLILGHVNKLPNAKYKVGGYGYTLLRLDEAKKVKELDVLILGSSHVYRAFDTRILEKHGFKSFNYGTSAQPPYVTYFLLRDFLKREKPKHIVMDLYWSMLQKTGVEAGVDIISNSEINETAIDIARESDDIMLYNTLLISYIRQLYKPISTDEQKDFKNDQYVQNGFVESFIKQNADDSLKLASLKKITFKPADIQVNSVKKIVKLCKENNIDLTFVVTPVTREKKETVLNYNEYSRFINQLAQENNIRLIDYNQRPDLELNSQTDFYDASHLNQSGVVKFNKVFINDFIKLYNGKLANSDK